MQRYIETELGVERFCKHCEEYYPVDEEFWYITGKLKNGLPAVNPACKGCYHHIYKPYRKVSSDTCVKSRWEDLFA